MGNYKLKLSDLIPNSWLFSKLKHKKQHSSASPIPHFHSHHFTPQLTAHKSLPEPPRKSSKRDPGRRSTATTTTAAASRSSPNRVVTSSSGCSYTGVEYSFHAKKPSHRFPVNPPGDKFRIMNSRRVSSRETRAAGKGSLSESMAIMKSTKDPERDFKESMVEMIVENNMSEANELEQLLACYLCLNSDEYHYIIINVFKQIWFHMLDFGMAN